METSPLNCCPNQWTGSYMIWTSVMRELTDQTTADVIDCYKKNNIIVVYVPEKNITSHLIWLLLFHDEGSYHIETSPLICISYIRSKFQVSMRVRSTWTILSWTWSYFRLHQFIQHRQLIFTTTWQLKSG